MVIFASIGSAWIGSSHATTFVATWKCARQKGRCKKYGSSTSCTYWRCQNFGTGTASEGDKWKKDGSYGDTSTTAVTDAGEWTVY